MKNKGFSLIELVVIITVIAILAAIAAPKFIDISSDAKSALVKNIAANLTTAINFSLMKDVINGGNSSAIDYNGNTVTFIAGNPRPDATQMRYLLDMDLPSRTFTANWATVACTNSEYCLVGNRPYTDNSLPYIAEFISGTGVFFWPESYVLDNCFAYYLNLADNSEPIIGSVTSGC